MFNMRLLCERYPKIVIALMALVSRLLLGYLFYGSIDVSAFIAINKHTFNDTLSAHPYLIWCAFPVIPFYLWLAGLLTIKTSLPLAFCFKIIPICFDVLLALLVFDIVKKIRPPQAFTAGMLYALSPGALIITCIHGQWDAVPLLFFLLGIALVTLYQDSYKKYFIYGALFAFSFLLKPMTLAFLIFFFVPWGPLRDVLGRGWDLIRILMGAGIACVIACFLVLKTQRSVSMNSMMAFFTPPVLCTFALVALACALYMLYKKPWRLLPDNFLRYLSYQSMSIAGLLSMIAVCFACLAWYGFNLITVIDKVLRYCNQGIVTFGLPFAYPFNQEPIITLLKNRFWIVGLLGVIAWFYYKKRIDIFSVLLLSFACIFSFAGISPQYILWILPLMLITGYYRVAALFNAVFCIFCLLYYMNPLANPEVINQSMISFAPLKGFVWLTPPLFFTYQFWLPVMHVLGNYCLPGICFYLVVRMFYLLRPQNYVRMLRTFDRLRTKHERDKKNDRPELVEGCERFEKEPTNNITIIPDGFRQEKLVIHKNIYLLFSIGLTALITLLIFTVDQTNFGPLFSQALIDKMKDYQTITLGHLLSGDYAGIYPANIVFLLLFMTGIWSWQSYRVAYDTHKKS